MEAFDLGDIVTLKTGGILMTAEQWIGQEMVACVWFDSIGRFHRLEIGQFALKKVESPGVGSCVVESKIDSTV